MRKRRNHQQLSPAGSALARRDRIAIGALVTAPVTFRELCEVVGSDRRTTQRQLARLRAAGWGVQTSAERPPRYRIAPDSLPPGVARAAKAVVEKE
jgi:CRP-like cAMP-binding protein